MEDKRLTQMEFTKMYAKRLKEKGINEEVADKLLRFILKTIMFNALIGNLISINGFGAFQVKENSGKKYNFQKKMIEDFCFDKLYFNPYKSLKNKIRKSYDH